VFYGGGGGSRSSSRRRRRRRGSSRSSGMTRYNIVQRCRVQSELIVNIST
jgi:hypothetical protein